MSREKLYEIDRRAHLLGVPLSRLASEAKVGPNTMSRFRAEPEKVNPRTITKLELKLEAMEKEQENA